MTKDWNFNQPLESKSENQEDQDKIAALFGNHQGGNDVNYEAAFQKRKQAPVTESNSSSKPKVTEVRTGKETDITTSYQQHLKRLIADNNSDVFKKLIHRLSDMSVQDLEKIDRLLDIIFTPDQESEQVKTESIYREETLDDTLKEAKNQLHKEQLEKNLERFRKNNK